MKEYKAVSLSDSAKYGRTSAEDVARVINKHAQGGWRLVNSYSSPVSMQIDPQTLSYQAIVECQHIYIFERDV